MNISNIKNCYGCGVCATACPRKIISLALNSDGFYEPYLNDKESCIDCGICVEVCAYSHKDISLTTKKLKSYAAWSKDVAVRKKCSSGGVGFEVGRFLLESDYKVCGVRYNVETGRAEHYIASTIEELIPSIGSKYIQSYTVDGFKSIDRNQKYLVTGTPCQIDSFRRYIRRIRREDNFVLLDFFCHGVPSMLLWKKYVAWAEQKVGKLTYVSWRNKFTGWHDSWAMAIDGADKGENVDWHDSYNFLIREKKGYLNSRLSQNDMFYRFFLSDSCLGKACYNACKYKKDKSAADIRIGDLWGNVYQKNEDGVSAVIAFTEKGEDILKQCNCELEPCSIDVVTEGQMKSNPKRGFLGKLIMFELKKSERSLRVIFLMLRSYQIMCWIFNSMRHPNIIIQKLKK